MIVDKVTTVNLPNGTRVEVIEREWTFGGDTATYVNVSTSNTAVRVNVNDDEVYA